MSMEQQSPGAQNTSGRSLAKAVARLFSADVLVAAAGMALSVVVARLGGADELALFALAFAVITVVEMLVDFGSDLHVARSIGRRPGLTYSVVREALRFKLFSCALLVPGFSIGIFVAATDPSAALFLALSILLVPARAHVATSSAALRALEATRVLARIQGVIGVLQFLSAAVLMWRTGELGHAMLAIFCGDIFRALVLRRALNGIMPAEETSRRAPSLIEALRRNAGLAFINITSVLSVRAPLFLLDHGADRSSVGYYAGAARFINILRMLPGVLFNVLLPGFAAEKSGGSLLRNSLLGGMIVGFPIAAALALAAPWLVPWLLGPEFVYSIVVLQILAGRFVIHLLVHVFEAHLLAAGRERWVNSVFFSELALLAVGALYILNLNAEVDVVPAAEQMAWLTVITHAISCIALAFLTKLQLSRRQDFPEPDSSEHSSTRTDT